MSYWAITEISNDSEEMYGIEANFIFKVFKCKLTVLTNYDTII